MEKIISSKELVNPVLDFWVKIPENFHLDDFELRDHSEFNLRTERYARKIKMSFSEHVTERNFPQPKYTGSDLAHLEIFETKQVDYYLSSETYMIRASEIIKMKNAYLTGKDDLSQYAIRVLYELFMKTPDVMFGFGSRDLLIPIQFPVPPKIQVTDTGEHVILRTRLREESGFQQWKRVWDYNCLKENDNIHFGNLLVILSRDRKDTIPEVHFGTWS